MSITQSAYQKKGTWKKTLVARVVTWHKIQDHIIKAQVSRWHITSSASSQYTPCKSPISDPHCEKEIFIISYG